MKLLPRLSLDQIGHPPGGPQRSAIAQRLGTGFQTATEHFQLGRLQPGLTARSPSLAERLGSLLFPSLMPAADRLAVNPQSPGDLALMEASIKQPGGFEPPPFQFIKIAFNAWWITHARKFNTRNGICHYILRQSVICSFHFGQHLLGHRPIAALVLMTNQKPEELISVNHLNGVR
jgi:hypothetical protein